MVVEIERKSRLRMCSGLTTTTNDQDNLTGWLCLVKIIIMAIFMKKRICLFFKIQPIHKYERFSIHPLLFIMNAL